MANPNPNDNNDQCNRREDDPFARAHRHFDSMFNTLWALPSAIYQRGNDHGREFNRMYNERRGEREEEQEREDGRGRRACGWRGRGRRPVNDERELERGKEEDMEKVMDDWVEKVVRELERGERQAKSVYDEFWGKDEFWGTTDEKEGKVVKDEFWGTTDQKKEANEEKRAQYSWSDVFPAWSNEAPKERADGPHEHIFGCRREHENKRPLTSAAKDVEDTIDKLHSDFGRMLGDAEQWRRRFHQGYQRDSRLWDEEGLFGPSVPFSRPLSTLFSLGMRPFLPQDSAMAYILYSEYSPLHLEHEDGFDGTWRERFEDLLKAQEGKRLEGFTTRPTTKVEWIGRIVPLLKEGEGGKGALSWGTCGAREPGVQVAVGDYRPEPQASTPSSTGQRITEEEPETELDMYERQLGDIPRAGVENPTQTITQVPSILSTMTTTERHVAPDGSVTTKTVLKKRFADGREESSETVETSPGPSAVPWTAQERHVGNEANVRAESNIIKEAKGGKGWFWRS